MHAIEYRIGGALIRDGAPFVFASKSAFPRNQGDIAMNGKWYLVVLSTAGLLATGPLALASADNQTTGTSSQLHFQAGKIMIAADTTRDDSSTMGQQQKTSDEPTTTQQPKKKSTKKKKASAKKTKQQGDNPNANPSGTGPGLSPPPGGSGNPRPGGPGSAPGSKE